MRLLKQKQLSKAIKKSRLVSKDKILKKITIKKKLPWDIDSGMVTIILVRFKSKSLFQKKVYGDF